jgi:Ca2+-binding EF-hand superfamily protein
VVPSINNWHFIAAGTITVDELEKVLGAVGGTDPKEIKAILDKVDKNKDGSIDYEEFAEMMKPASDDPVRMRKEVAIKF